MASINNAAAFSAQLHQLLRDKPLPHLVDQLKEKYRSKIGPKYMQPAHILVFEVALSFFATRTYDPQRTEPFEIQSAEKSILDVRDAAKLSEQIESLQKVREGWGRLINSIHTGNALMQQESQSLLNTLEPESRIAQDYRLRFRQNPPAQPSHYQLDLEQFKDSAAEAYKSSYERAVKDFESKMVVDLNKNPNLKIEINCIQVVSSIYLLKEGGVLLNLNLNTYMWHESPETGVQ